MRKSWIVFFGIIIVLGYIQANKLYNNQEIIIDIEKSSGFSGKRTIVVYGKVVQVDARGRKIGNFDIKPVFKITYKNAYTYVIPDNEGNIKGRISSLEELPLKQGINFATITPIGTTDRHNELTYRFINTQHIKENSVSIPFFHMRQTQKTVLVVEFDNTLVQSKMFNLTTSLTENYKKIIPRMEIIHTLKKIDQGDYITFYLSNQPQSSYDALAQFIKHYQLPPGPFFLRNIGFPILSTGDGSIDQYTYECIKDLAFTLEDKKIILLGSNILKDEKLLTKIQKKLPGVIQQVIIFNVKTSTPKKMKAVSYTSSAQTLEKILRHYLH